MCISDASNFNLVPFTVILACSEVPYDPVNKWTDGIRCQYSETGYEVGNNGIGYFDPKTIVADKDGDCTFGYSDAGLVDIGFGFKVQGTKDPFDKLVLYFTNGFVDGNSTANVPCNDCIYNLDDPRLAPAYARTCGKSGTGSSGNAGKSPGKGGQCGADDIEGVYQCKLTCCLFYPGMLYFLPMC